MSFPRWILPPALLLHILTYLCHRSMTRLRDSGQWSLFNPTSVPLLKSTYGDQFSHAYEHYEDTVEPTERLAARDLWTLICRSQQESGTPFIIYQDAVNRESGSAPSSAHTLRRTRDVLYPAS